MAKARLTDGAPQQEAELVHIESGVPALPEHLKHLAGNTGLENIEREDIILPRLGLCQSTSPQRKKNNQDYIEGLEEGDFFNSVNKTNYGPTLEVIPIYRYVSRIKFKPFEEKGIECQSHNGKDGGILSPTCGECAFSQWNGKTPPLCTKFQNYLCITKNERDLVIYGFKSTATKAAKQLNSMLLTFQPKLSIFSRFFRFTSFDDKAGVNDFKGIIVAGHTRWFVDEAEAKLCAALYEEFSGKVIQTHGVTDEADTEKKEEDSDFD